MAFNCRVVRACSQFLYIVQIFFYTVFQNYFIAETDIMTITRISKKIMAACLSLGLLASLPAAADDLDVLGQFLEQNFPTQDDPLGAFALQNPAGQIEAQAAFAGPLLTSQSALIVNNRTGEVLFQKNPNRVMPIA